MRVVKGRMRLRGSRVQVGTVVTVKSVKASGYLPVVRVTRDGLRYITHERRKFDGPTGHKTITIETPVYARPSLRVYWPKVSQVRYPKGSNAPRVKSYRDYGICPVCGAKRLREMAEHEAFLARAVYDETLDKLVEPPPARKPTTKPTPEETERKRKAKARRARDARRKKSVGRHKARA